MDVRLFKNITHGVYVIGVMDSGVRNAFTAAWVMQVSFDPLMLAFSINPKHYSYQLLRSGGVCTVNVLGRNQMKLAEHFGRPLQGDKMAFYQWRRAQSGAPYLEDALAYYDCSVSHYCHAGDHELVVCHITDAVSLNNGVPMLYCETGEMDKSTELYSDGS